MRFITIAAAVCVLAGCAQDTTESRPASTDLCGIATATVERALGTRDLRESAPGRNRFPVTATSTPVSCTLTSKDGTSKGSLSLTSVYLLPAAIEARTKEVAADSARVEVDGTPIFYDTDGNSYRSWSFCGRVQSFVELTTTGDAVGEKDAQSLSAEVAESAGCQR